MKYYATFTANNGNTWQQKPWEYTNKRKAIREIRATLRSEHFQQTGNKSTYEVYDEKGNTITRGSLNDKGWWSNLLNWE